MHTVYFVNTFVNLAPGFRKKSHFTLPCSGFEQDITAKYKPTPIYINVSPFVLQRMLFFRLYHFDIFHIVLADEWKSVRVTWHAI